MAKKLEWAPQDAEAAVDTSPVFKVRANFCVQRISGGTPDANYTLQHSPVGEDKWVTAPGRNVDFGGTPGGIALGDFFDGFEHRIYKDATEETRTDVEFFIGQSVINDQMVANEGQIKGG